MNSVAKKSTNEVLELAKNLFEKWNTLSHEQKREVIETITEKIIVGKDEINIGSVASVIIEAIFGYFRYT